MAKVALTNEPRAHHFAKTADYWKLADAAQDTSFNSEKLRVKPEQVRRQGRGRAAELERTCLLALTALSGAARARPITAIRSIATARGRFVQRDVLLLLVRPSACCRCFCKIGSVWFAKSPTGSFCFFASCWNLLISCL